MFASSNAPKVRSALGSLEIVIRRPRPYADGIPTSAVAPLVQSRCAQERNTSRLARVLRKRTGFFAKRTRAKIHVAKRRSQAKEKA
jgi:hypothetical protein